MTVDNLAWVAHEIHDDRRARKLSMEALRLNESSGDAADAAMNKLHLGILDGKEGHWADARTRIAEALGHYRSIGFLQYAAEWLEAGSTVANHVGAPGEAAFFLGSAGRLRDQAGLAPVQYMAALRDRQAAAMRAALGAQEAEAHLAAGRAAPPDAAMARAITFLRG